jgi:hypothetical protein
MPHAAKTPRKDLRRLREQPRADCQCLATQFAVASIGEHAQIDMESRPGM